MEIERSRRPDIKDTMTEAQRKANQKWGKENYPQISCKVRKDICESFKGMCADAGITANAALVATVEKCVADPDAWQVIRTWTEERPKKEFKPEHPGRKPKTEKADE